MSGENSLLLYGLTIAGITYCLFLPDLMDYTFKLSRRKREEFNDFLSGKFEPTDDKTLTRFRKRQIRDFEKGLRRKQEEVPCTYQA